MIAKLFLTLVVFVTAPFVQTQTRPQPQTGTPNDIKVLQLLKASGFQYKLLDQHVWGLAFKGKSMASIPVYVMSVEDVLIVSVTVAENGTFKLIPPLMSKLLKYADGSGTSVVALDDKNNITVRAELQTRLCDLEEFKRMVYHTAMSADQVDAEIKPFRNP